MQAVADTNGMVKYYKVVYKLVHWHMTRLSWLPEQGILSSN